MKVFIADDSEIVRERLKAMLSEIPEIEILGEAWVWVCSKYKKNKFQAIGDRKLKVEGMNYDEIRADGWRNESNVSQTMFRFLLLTIFLFSSKLFD